MVEAIPIPEKTPEEGAQHYSWEVHRSLMSFFTYYRGRPPLAPGPNDLPTRYLGSMGPGLTAAGVNGPGGLVDAVVHELDDHDHQRQAPLSVTAQQQHYKRVQLQRIK